MTLPKRSGYNVQAVYEERLNRMNTELICLDGPVNRTAFIQHPLMGHLVTALHRHGVGGSLSADVTAGSNLSDTAQPGDLKIMTLPSTTAATSGMQIPSVPTADHPPPLVQVKCGFCHVIDEDSQNRDAILGHGVSSRLSLILEEEEAEMPLFDYTVSSVNNTTSSILNTDNNTDDNLNMYNALTPAALAWLDENCDFGDFSLSDEGSSSGTHTPSVARQLVDDNFWNQLLDLHTEAHITLSLCASPEQRNAVDMHLTQRLDDVRSKFLSQSQATRPPTVPGGNNAVVPSPSTLTNRSSSQRRQLPASSLTVLKKWLYEHRDNPYPTDEEKKLLAKAANLSYTQVRNWFANVRNRKRNLLKVRTEAERTTPYTRSTRKTRSSKGDR